MLETSSGTLAGLRTLRSGWNTPTASCSSAPRAPQLPRAKSIVYWQFGTRQPPRPKIQNDEHLLPLAGREPGPRPDAANPEESPQITTRSARRARHAGQDRVAELEQENSQLRAELDRLRSQKRPIRRSNSLGSGRPKRTAEKRRRHLLRDSIMHTVEEDEGGDGSGERAHHAE